MIKCTPLPNVQLITKGGAKRWEGLIIEENLGCTMSSMADAHFGIVKVELCVFH